jgi:drug/metabolite transporter (DMT)-like permease
MKTRNDQSRALIALVLGAACISLAPILAKLARDWDMAHPEPLSPIGSAFWRMALSIPFFLWISWKDRSQFSAVRGSMKNLGWLILLPGLFFCLDLSVWHTSFEYTTVANSTLLANLATVATSAIGYFFLGERLTFLFVAGGILALGGVAGLVGFSFQLNQNYLFGDILALITAFLYAGYMVTIKVQMRTLPIRIVLLLTAIVSSIFLAVIGLIMGEPLVPHSTDSWASLIALAISSQVVGQYLIGFGISKLPVGLSSLILLIQPMLVVLLGWLIFAQSVSILQALSGIVILVGIYLAKQGARI